MSAPATSSAGASQPHPLVDLGITVVAPSIMLETLSKPERLGPAWALVAALLLPLGYGLYCWIQKRGWNFFSSLGLVAIVVTGGLGLLKLNATWFALKEAAFPLFLGIAFPLSHRWGKPLVNDLLLNPEIINHNTLRRSLDSPEKRVSFQSLLVRASWGMALAMLLSAIANSVLVIYLLGDHPPGSEAYVKAIGTQNWVGFIVIGIPMLGATLGLLFWLLNAVQRLTGLERADLMNPGKTVRRQVG